MKRITLLLAAIVCCVFGFCKEPKEPTSYNYQRGVECLRNNNEDEGKKYLQKELQENRKNGYAYAWLAAAYANEGEFGNAIYNLEQAHKYLPKGAKSTIAWAHKLRAMIYLDMQDTINGLKEYALAIKYNPQKEDYYLERGEIYRELNQWDKSDSDFRQFIKLTPGIIRGHLELGENLMKQKKFEDALEVFKYAHKLAPRSFTFSAMAWAECEMGKYEDAAQHVIDALNEDINDDKAYSVLSGYKNPIFFEIMKSKLDVQILKHPNTAELLGYQSMLLCNMKDYYGAIENLKKVKKLVSEPGVDEAISNLYANIGNWKRALEHINIAIKADSTNESFVETRMNLYSSMDSVSSFDKDAAWLLERNPDNAHYYFARAQEYFFRKEYQKCIDDFTLCLAINQTLNYGRYLRGRSYLALGDTISAMRDFERAHDETVRDMTRSFTAIYLHRPEEARRIADSILMVDTIDYTERYNVACAYSLLGDKEKAYEIIEAELENGYIQFGHMLRDPDLVPLYGPRLDSLIGKYERRMNEYIRMHEVDTMAVGYKAKVVEIPFSLANGVTKVDCIINGLPLNFIFDTGASDVTLSQTEANFMLKNGYLSKRDVIGKQRYQIADGNVSVGTTFILNHISFGGLELTDVKASVVENQKAPLLLGQSVLSRLGKIEIDNERRVLKITTY